MADIAGCPHLLLNVAFPPFVGWYGRAHTKSRAEKMTTFDEFVFVTPEFNHSVPTAVMNARRYPQTGWKGKAAGFVGYRSAGVVLAVEHVRGIAGELRMADAQAEAISSLATDFGNDARLWPDPQKETAVERMLNQGACWSNALAAVRAHTPSP
ncbi:MAG: NAD(P)H-dependent oxidoreductase [Thermoplasmata archaeon]|nr:NAD(P)H-dependent oxidoreductase [Thermoplasmata archaeon]MCI4359460.1 NAD(P)H-dependent oxidoreductase [Thermoplasmata archaeon]